MCLFATDWWHMFVRTPIIQVMLYDIDIIKLCTENSCVMDISRECLNLWVTITEDKKDTDRLMLIWYGSFYNEVWFLQAILYLEWRIQWELQYQAERLISLKLLPYCNIVCFFWPPPDSTFVIPRVSWGQHVACINVTGCSSTDLWQIRVISSCTSNRLFHKGSTHKLLASWLAWV